MTKGSDIIKIGFDYKSSLEQFEKETNGVFDGISAKAGKQKISIQLDAKNDKVIEKIKELQKLKLDKFTFEFGESGLAEQLKTFDQLEKKISEIINLSKGIDNKNIGNGIGNSIVDEKSLNNIIDLFGKMESHLGEIKKVFSDVGDGEEFSPLLSTIDKINTSISELSTSVKGIGLNMNIDVGSDTEAEAKVQSKISNALQAYQRLFDHIKMSSAGGAMINTNFFEFDINQYDTMMGKLQAYKKFIDNMRKEAKTLYNGNDVLYQDTNKSYWTAASAAMGQVTRAFNEMNAAGDTSPLNDLFGKTDLTEVVFQLEQIVLKLDEISQTAGGFKDLFSNGLNVSTSIEEVEKLTNRVKELEDELAKIKITPAVDGNKSNISSENISSNEAEKYQKITSDTVSVLNDVGKTEEQIIAKIQRERLEAEANNDVLREHLVLLDKAGKVVANHWGSKSNVNGTFTSEQLSQAEGGKIIHVHPGKASFFGGKDLQHLLQDNIYEQIKQIDLVWGDSTLSVDKSTLTKESSDTLLNIMKNVRKTLTEVYGDNPDGAPSQEAREHINAIEKEIFKSLAKQLNVPVSENGNMAQEVTNSLSDTDKAIIQKFKGIESSVIKNIDSSTINSTIKDVFQDGSDSSSTAANEQVSAMEKVETATEQATQAKQDFVTANENVQSSVDGSKSPLQLEAELMQQIAKEARDAADAKKEFVEANKQVEQSANDSNDSMNNGHSDNAEPSGTKRYKKKGYKAHDTGNHDNEETVAKKSELGATLKKLQSGIIASIDESTSFIKEVADFYDSANDLVKTQMKVVDKDGSQRTYTTSYSKDGDDFKAWTSHIDTQKFKNAEEQEAKEVQKVWEDNLKAITDYMDAKTKLNNLEASDKKSNKKSNEIADLTNEVEKARVKAEEARAVLSSMVNPHNVDIDTWDKWLKVMEEFRQAGEGSSQSIAKLKDAIANVNTSELTSIQKYIDSAQSKLNTTDKSREDSEKSSDFKDYVKQVQEYIDAIVAEKQRLENALESGDIEIIDESQLSKIKDLKQNLVEANLGFKTIFKGSADVSRWKEIDTITKYMEKNTRISKEAKIQFQGFIEELKTKGADANVEKIHQSFLEVCDVERKARREGQSFLDVLRDKVWYQWAAQIGTYFSFNDIINYGKQAASIVTELNTQITDLAKVSEATSKQIYADFDSYADIAKDIGGTISDTISATADWSRNGYSIPDSKELAEVALLYKNVGDGIDIDEANESLISTLRGFKMEAEEAIDIIDIFNEVSNNEPISSSGIGEALQRSAASFNAANTSLQESVALISATRLYRLVEYMETCIKNIFNCHRSLYYHSLQYRGNHCMNV